MIKRYCKIIAGYGLIALGFIGLFLPFLQGILFLALGCMILSSESPTFRKLMDWVRTKYPRLHATLHFRKKRKPDRDDSEKQSSFETKTV
jgi:uncharacterized membrane protein YbaN (DUF454 family)